MVSLELYEVSFTQNFQRQTKGAMEEAFLSLKRVICQVRVPAFPLNTNFFIVRTIKKCCRDQSWYLILLSSYIGDNSTQPIKAFASL